MSKRNSQTSRIRKKKMQRLSRSLSVRSIFILEKEAFWYFKLHACITIWMITMMITDMMMMTLLEWPCSHWEVMYSPNITFFKHNFTTIVIITISSLSLSSFFCVFLSIFTFEKKRIERTKSISTKLTDKSLLVFLLIWKLKLPSFVFTFSFPNNHSHVCLNLNKSSRRRDPV